MRKLIIFLVFFTLIGCRENEVLMPTDFYTTDIPVKKQTDSTWAKNIIGGKSFFVSLGNKPDSIVNGLEIYLKPVDFKSKRYSVTFIYHKKPIIDYFNARQKRDPSLDIIAVAIGISPFENNELRSFMGSIEINNKKPNFPVAALIISDAPETFTYEIFKSIIPAGSYMKEYFLSSGQKLLIRSQRFERQYKDTQTLIFDPLEKVK